MRSIASGGEAKGIKDKQYVCSECNGYFSNKGSILHHVCGSKKGEADEYLYKCQKCDQTFKHGFFITHHKRTHGCFPPGYENVKKGQAHEMFSQISQIRIYEFSLPNNMQYYLFFSNAKNWKKPTIFEQ